MKSYLQALLILGFGALANAQEVLEPLVYNPSLKENAAAGAQRSVERRPFIYEIDTVPMPFVDDFSTNRIKRFNAQKTDANVSLEVRVLFTVNGEHPKQLAFMREPTYSYVKSGSTIDSSLNAPLYITFYNDGQPIGADTGYTNVITTIDLSSALVTKDTLLPDEILINTFDSLYIVADDGSLWVTPADELRARGPYVNNVFGFQPPTQGVLTFDGVDAQGVPYDYSSPTAEGEADSIVSKPIYIDSTMSGVFLSFYYQAGGYGNAPNESDSLVLELWNVVDSTWQHGWSTAGGLGDPLSWNQQVFVAIEAPEYRRPGFKFRFKNYATLSANLDHWNIDYVRLDKNRDTANEASIPDVAFVAPLSSLCAPYTLVPYQHYLANPSALQADTLKTSMANLDTVNANITEIGFDVFDPSGTVVSSFQSFNPNLAAQTLLNTNFILSAAPMFTDVGSETATFSVRSYLDVSGNNDLRLNDTIRREQKFAYQYAYDDGTAEKAYALTGAGTELAQLYETPISDTLEAISFNFPITLDSNATDLTMVLKVWKDLDEEPIYESPFLVSPKYSSDNGFQRYKLDTALVVNGIFYVGYEQVEATKIYVGFDANTNARQRLSYRTDGQWFESSFAGALLMRPDYGSVQPPLSVFERQQTDRFEVFPNPCADNFTAIGSPSIVVVNAHGQTIYSGGGQSVNTSQWPVGIYHVVGSSGASATLAVVR